MHLIDSKRKSGRRGGVAIATHCYKALAFSGLRVRFPKFIAQGWSRAKRLNFMSFNRNAPTRNPEAYQSGAAWPKFAGPHPNLAISVSHSSYRQCPKIENGCRKLTHFPEMRIALLQHGRRCTAGWMTRRSGKECASSRQPSLSLRRELMRSAGPDGPQRRFVRYRPSRHSCSYASTGGTKGTQGFASGAISVSTCCAMPRSTSPSASPGWIAAHIPSASIRANGEAGDGRARVGRLPGELRLSPSAGTRERDA